MNSFILHFKPWLVALALLIVIECIYFAAAQPRRLSWNSFLDLQFTQAESFQRLVTYEKIIAFENADPDIIQVGDSSGLHGVQPPLVVSHIPDYRYLNLSVATNLGYSGYYQLAKLQLQRSPNAKYLVLYASAIGGVPRKTLWDDGEKLMGPLIQNEFLSPLHRLVQLPTLAARQSLTDYVYSQGYRYKSKGSPLSTNRGYLAFEFINHMSTGWTRETDVEGDIPANIYKAILPDLDSSKEADPQAIREALRKLPKITDEQFFNWRRLSRESYFDHVYGAFAELAREHQVKLVLIFNPFPESSKQPAFEELIDWKAIENALHRVRQQHPDVIVTNFDFWPDEKFSVFSHVDTPSSGESSHRVGKIMKEVIGDGRPNPRVQPNSPVTRLRAIDIDFQKSYCGYGWTDQTGATNTFPLQYVGSRNRTWLYAQIGEGKSHKLRSEFRANDPATASRMELKVNGIRASRIGLGKTGDAFFTDHLITEEMVRKYRGWLTMEFEVNTPATENSNGKRSIAFQRIVSSPIGNIN